MKRAVLLPLASSKTDKAAMLRFAKCWHRYGAACGSVVAETMTWHWLLRWAGAPR